MADDRLGDLPAHDRRRFFAAGFSHLLRPLADYIEKKLPPDLKAVRTVLRPPGAMEEKAFLEICYRCGRCADACPADAIQLTPPGDAARAGTPFVDPDRQACVICDELACMKICPSGALQLVDRLAIRMGLAQVDVDLCVRAKGEECRICIDRCPLGAVAIRLSEMGEIQVIDPRASGQGCTGCGVCQQHCPTTPIKAIQVE